MRLRTRHAPAWGLLLALTLAGPSLATTGRKSPKTATRAPSVSPSAPADAVVPDITRYFGTWLWVKSEGIVETSNPETKGAARTLTLNSDLTYELHQRRDTRDSVLCRGSYSFSEESGEGRATMDYLDFAGWFEAYEHRMTAEFDGPDTLLLAGDACENCPDHTYVRGKTTMFEDSVRVGQPYQRALWDGLRFELKPLDLGWRIMIRDSTRPEVDLASVTPPYHFVPNPRDIEGWHFRDKANTGPNQGDVNAPQRVRDFIFSPEVGRSIRDPAEGTATITDDDVERAGQRGRGVLEILELDLTPPAKNARAGIQSMRFRVAIQEARGRT
jgi:hypothetical protein